MSCIIAIAGKGGVGKTTISAMLVHYLLTIDKPVLAVDADPNSNLNAALGMEYEETIADIREEAKKKIPENFSKSEFFSLRLEEAIAEGNGFDLLVMGRPEGPGCYCAVNNILREYLAKISKKYQFVVIDNEAGMEHLSRRTAADIDLLLLISDPTMVGIGSAINAFNTAKSAGIKIKEISLIINKSKGRLDPDKLKLIEETGLKIGGYIDFQDAIQKNSEKGGSVKAEIASLAVFDSILAMTHQLSLRGRKAEAILS
ncbi:MAG: carbon monoxide dehydrogenase [Candidatus Omnitrophica bacterium CG02_land_8_20_14_3_00__42_8]|nr:MAG: carbon monoxide dehydrogenase [Candidatus Omnitrophica bacterium CG02_land_8_20_14_3_00__42_8]